MCGAKPSGRVGEANRYLPPRSVWNTFSPRRLRAERPTEFEHVMAMAGHAIRELKTGRYKWARDLRELIDSVRSEAFRWDRTMPLTHAEVFMIPKSRPGYGEAYRVVVGYGLREQLLSSCAAAYLRDLVDGQLTDSVLSSRSGGRRTPPPTHHDAVGRIQRFREAAGEKPIYCAESDIASFFDTISHAVVVQEVERVLRACGRDVDERIFHVIRSLLRGYDLLGAVIPAAKKLVAAQGVRSPVLPDPLAALAKCGIAVPLAGIGIPQGNALSGVLANIVLACADQAVISGLEAAGGHGLYVRYVDDTIFAHTDRTVCAAALAAYEGELRALLLPAHESVETPKYGKTFWNAKSKCPYSWSCDGEPASVPWLGFVGYQIRRDGVTRPRPASIERHKQRLREVLAIHKDALDVVIASGQPIPPPEVLVGRLERHLVSVGVGRSLPYATGADRIGPSWLGGFAALGGQRVDTAGLRELDRERGRLVRQFRTHARGRLRGLPPLVEPAVRRRTWSRFWPRFYGRPYGYARLVHIGGEADVSDE